MEISKVIILFCCLVFFSGCSSSNSVRYASNEEKKPEKTTAVRFTSVEPESSRDINLASADTVYQDLTEDDDPDDMPLDEKGIDITEVVKTFGAQGNSAAPSAEFSDYRERVLMEIIKYLNTPYKFGGNSKKGIDCSAFTQTIYANTLECPLLRSAREQFTEGLVIEDREELQFGDLVFFNTRKRVKPGHVGIYIGDNLFAHASSKHGVIVSSLDHEYYSKRYMGGRRMEEAIQQYQ